MSVFNERVKGLETPTVIEENNCLNLFFWQITA